MSTSYSGIPAARTSRPTTRCTTRASTTSSCATRPAAATPPRATRRRRARSASCFATSGPGATNIVTPLTDAMMDSVPVVFFTGQVRTDLLGHGRLPGGGHVRHHDADRQALVHDPAPDGDPAGRARGVPHRPLRAPGAGADRHADRPHAGRDRLRAGRRRPPARLPADHRGQPEADPARREGARQRAPARDLRGRRRDQRQRVGGADRARARRRAAGHLHADGPRRLPGARTRSGWGCSACTGRGPRTTRWTRPT